MTQPRIDWRAGLTWSLVALIALGLIAWQAPALETVSWKYDEGLNVAKAQLVREGHALYGEVWSDQPPAFTIMLVAAFRLMGPSVAVGRGLVLALTVTGLLAIAAMGRWVGGDVGAIVAAALYALLPHLQELSRLIMIGLPALSLAMVSLAVAIAYRQRRWIGLPFLIGAVFSLSLLTKPITAPMLLPLGVLCLEGRDGSSRRWATIRGTGWLVIGLLAPALVATVLFGGGAMLRQVAGTLVEARGYHGGSPLENLGAIWSYLTDDKWSLSYSGLLVLGALGLMRLGRERRWQELAFLGTWAIAMWVALVIQSPLRRHHLLGLMPPIVLAASASVQPLFAMFSSVQDPSRRDKVLAGLTVAALVLAGVQAVPMMRAGSALRDAAVAQDGEALARLDALRYLEERTPLGSLVVTDDPMLAFKTGRRIPPELAVPSARRIEAGDLPSESLISTTAMAQPAAVALWEQRLTRAVGFWDWVRQDYYAVRAFRDDRWIYAPERGLGSVFPQPALGQGISFLGSAFGSLAVEPGETLEATVLMQADEGLDQDLTLFVHLLDEHGNLWAQQDLPPLDGWYPTSQWAPGERVAQMVRLQVRDETPPGEKILAVGLYGSEGRTPLTDGAGSRLGGDQAILTPRPVVRWDRAEEPQPPQHAMGASLGGAVALEGFDLPQTAYQHGDKIDIMLYWRCTAPMLTSYTVFVHLVDKVGQVVAQRDARPGDGLYPTTGWLVGEPILDGVGLQLPRDLAPGAYHLAVGMYDLATGERLPVIHDGQPVNARLVNLGATLQVMP